MSSVTCSSGLSNSELVFARGAHPDTIYTFKHALVQDAAYESLLKSRRQQLHVLIARGLERGWPKTKESQPELLAHHYGRAGLAAEAAAYGLRAGQMAAKRTAFPEAIAHLKQALELIEVLPTGHQRQRQELELRAELADVLMATKGYAAPEVGEAFQHADDICDPVATQPVRLAILWGLFAYHLVRAEYQSCLSVGRRVLHLGIHADDAEAHVRAHTILGQAFLQYRKACRRSTPFRQRVRPIESRRSALRPGELGARRAHDPVDLFRA